MLDICMCVLSMAFRSTELSASEELELKEGNGFAFNQQRMTAHVFR